MLKFEALVDYDVQGKTRHVFMSENIDTAENDLLDIMDWVGYDVVSYKIEQIGQPKGE